MPYQAGSSAQRIRIGLTGLAFAFLLVLLGSVISRSSRDDVSNAGSRQPPTNRASRSPNSASRRGLAVDQQQQQQRREMSGARRRALVILVLALTAAAALGLAAVRRVTPPLLPRPATQRPRLLLLTSLPLLFNEDFSLGGGGSPALSKLATRYRIVPISVTDATDLAKGRMLLMAHPIAQTAGKSRHARSMGAQRGKAASARRSPLEWPSKRAAWRSVTTAAGVHGHGPARALGPQARRPGSARRRYPAAGRPRRPDRIARKPGGELRDQHRPTGRALPHRQGPGDGSLPTPTCSISNVLGEHGSRQSRCGARPSSMRSSAAREFGKSQTYPQANGKNRREQTRERPPKSRSNPPLPTNSH